MNWLKNNFLFIVIIILVIVILLQKCGGKNTDTPTIITKIDTTYVTVSKEIPTYIPKWKTKIEHDFIHDTIIKVDTAYVIGDYYSTYVYQDSLITDTLKLHINDSISQNKIKSRNIKYRLTYPVITVTNTVIEKKHEFYYGLGLAGGKDGLNSFGPELLLRTKHKSAYGLGLGINGNFQPVLSFKMYWKIGKK
jgi:hypothetical protein